MENANRRAIMSYSTYRKSSSKPPPVARLLDHGLGAGLIGGFPVVGAISRYIGQRNEWSILRGASFEERALLKLLRYLSALRPDALPKKRCRNLPSRIADRPRDLKQSVLLLTIPE